MSAGIVHRGRRAIAAAALGLLALAPGAAMAQGAPPPPVPFNVDERGVDQVSGTLVVGASDVAIGPSDEHGLRFNRQWVDTGWRLADVPTLSGSQTNPVVSVGGRSVSFTETSSGGAFTNDSPDGSTLVLSGSQHIFTGADGTVVEFGGYGFLFPVMQANLAVGTKITYPDGTYRQFHYTVGQHNNGSYLLNYYRLSSITSSTGYQLKLTYGDNDPQANLAGWLRIAKVSAINNAVEYCDPSAASCSLTGVWPEATYANWNETIDSVTTAAGTITYANAAGPQLTGIRPPGASSDLVTYQYSATTGQVTGVTVGPGSWSYAYGNQTTTTTDPAANTRSITYDASGRVLTSVAGGQTTTFSYCTPADADCPVGLLRIAQYPETNGILYAYDARGNRITETRYRKSSSTTPNLVTSATYPATCDSSNFRICNKPIATTDVRGKVTEYQYDAAHGGLTSVKLPAASSGATRAETRITYANRQAYYRGSSGTIVASGSNIALPVEISACRTTASCNGTADEQQVTIDYGPQTSGQANNLNPASTTVSLGNGTLAVTRTLTYDGIGHVASVDGPLAGAADTTWYSYDLAGRITGVIAPTGGAAKHQAVSYTYANGLPEHVKTGTVDPATVPTMATFVGYTQRTSGYDAWRRRTRETLWANGTQQEVADVVYDTSGRVTCSIVRMDPAQWGSPPGGCTPQTTGPQGPDRVTYNHYDALNRVWKVTSAYGTSAAADEAISTFTANGKVATLTDGEANRTSYTYDGHDRLVQTCYPVTTKGAGTSSTTDCESTAYDLVNNHILFSTRMGELLTFVYDDIGRLKAKSVPQRSSSSWDTHTRDVYYGYDLLNNLEFARFDGPSAASEGVTNTVNALGQVLDTTLAMDGISKTLAYAYDVAGRRTQLTYPDAQSVTFSYDALDRMTSAAPVTGSGFGYFYNDIGQLYHAWRGASSMQLGSDHIGRLTDLTVNLPGTASDNLETFTYNPARQIASRAQTNDLYAFPVAASFDRSYTANGRNQYTAAGPATFAYDANGNLSQSTAPNASSVSVTTTYHYDVENRMVGLDDGTTNAMLRYDPLGRLYEMWTSAGGTRRFLHDGTDLVAEYDAGGTMTQRYVHGPSPGDDPVIWYPGSSMASSNARYLMADERGSIVAVTDASGAAVAINTYDEYGIPDDATTGAIGTSGRFRYTGQAWLPEIGLYYYKARMYSPTLGRFMQTDPIGYADGMNWYDYVGGDPVNGLDPSGTECRDYNVGYRNIYRNNEGVQPGPVHITGTITSCSNDGLNFAQQANFDGGGTGFGLGDEPQSANGDDACTPNPQSCITVVAQRQAKTWINYSYAGFFSHVSARHFGNDVTFGSIFRPQFQNEISLLSLARFAANNAPLRNTNFAGVYRYTANYSGMVGYLQGTGLPTSLITLIVWDTGTLDQLGRRVLQPVTLHPGAGLP